MTRRESRETAVCLIYESGFSPERTPGETVALAREEREGGVSAFAEKLFVTAEENLALLDGKISESADNWRLDRIGRVTLAILRLASCEILFFPEIPVEITVNEALEITRRFDDEKSVAFVNGVLGRLAAGIEKPLAKQKPESESALTDES